MPQKFGVFILKLQYDFKFLPPRRKDIKPRGTLKVARIKLEILVINCFTKPVNSFCAKSFALLAAFRLNGFSTAYYGSAIPTREDTTISAMNNSSPASTTANLYRLISAPANPASEKLSSAEQTDFFLRQRRRRQLCRQRAHPYGTLTPLGNRPARKPSPRRQTVPPRSRSRTRDADVMRMSTVAENSLSG